MYALYSPKSPAPNLNLLDRFLLAMEQKEIETILVFNKSDLATAEEIEYLKEAYLKSGCKIFFVSAKEKKGINEIKELLQDKITTVAGPSGVGKSSIINLLQTEISMQIGEISEKIERGKHTTRHTEFITLERGGFIMDTPGFTSLTLYDMEEEEVRVGYREFTSCRDECRFNGCTHTHEPDCAVKKAVEEKKISRVRYENYVQIYQEVKDRKERRKGQR